MTTDITKKGIEVNRKKVEGLLDVATNGHSYSPVHDVIGSEVPSGIGKEVVIKSHPIMADTLNIR